MRVPFPNIGSLPAESYFPQIQRIDICPTHIALATHFMAAVNPKSLLRELSVTAPRSSARTDFSAFLSTLQHRTSLVSLTLDVSHTRYSMASDDLRPLLSLPNLKVLEFRTSYSTSIDDHFGTSMSLAWPLLISLDISRCLHAMDDDDIIPARYPTTETLVAFARNCPHLQSLAMNFDFTDFSEYAPPEPRVRQKSLTSVDFGSSLMEDPVPLAGLLSFLFPALSDIGPTRSSNSLQWERVAEMFTVFSIIREEERDYFVEVALELHDRNAKARELNV